MNAQDWIDELGLAPHPEGGYFKEVYRNPNSIQMTGGEGIRNLATSIYFLLSGNQKSHFHQLKSDELWYFHAGSCVLIHIFEQGEYRQEKLGVNVSQGEALQVLLPRQSIFAAEVLDTDAYVLMGCMVNPGFDFKDFYLLGRAELTQQFPECAELIDRFTFK